MSESVQVNVHRFSVSLVIQGKHRFYTLTVPSDVLAKTCFVSTRIEDPEEGFQRLLDKTRAQQIADYIDQGLGTIPNSVVLSAQPDAELKVVGRGKTLEFKEARKAFLIIDGQHRIFGFSLSKTVLRVPVVIYNGLSRRDESRLFIDINTKQRPVPNELLLDIKKLAEYESDQERLLGEIFDKFNQEPRSPLTGLLSPADRSYGKISRVTFNAAMKPIVQTFGDADTETIYEALRSYIDAFIGGCAGINKQGAITNPTVFRAVMLLFTEVAQRVQDKYGKAYTPQNFQYVLAPMFSRLPSSIFTKVGRSHTSLYATFSSYFKKQFSL